MNYNNANSSVDNELSKALQECVSYDPDTGLLTWKKKYSEFSPVVVGRQIGTPARGGLHFTFLGKTLFCHRVAWFLYYGEWPSTFLDHKNGCPEDNRIDNLRLADRRQNGANRKNTKKLYFKIPWSKLYKSHKKVAGNYRNAKEVYRRV